MKLCVILCFLFSGLFAHDPTADVPQWKKYVRLGLVQTGQFNSGIATYVRLKRTTEYTFKDMRFYGHFFNQDEEIRVRQKSSSRFLSFNWLYSFNTFIYEKNSFQNVDLRYHYNQGLGWLLNKTSTGNMTLELGVAFDNSDYLNTEQKTSYIRSAMTVDQSIGKLHSKVEIDYFHQMSKVEENDLSRWQVVTESQFKLFNHISLIFGMTQDIPLKGEFSLSNASFFITFAKNQPLSWTY